MDKIAKEIEAMAESMEKSGQDPKETLFKTIAALGKDGIKARLSNLSVEEKSLLKAALEEMNLNKAKSVEFDKESQSAKVIQGNVMDTVLQEEIGSDDADEKLMKPEAARHNHQGNSVIGWEGQVIKASEWTDEEVDMMVGPRSALMSEYDDDFSKAHIGFEKLKNKLSGEHGVSDPAGLAAAIGRKKYGKQKFQSAAAHGKKIKKSEEILEKKQGVPKGADEATHERCVRDVKAKGHSKGSAYAICNAAGAGMKKADCSACGKPIPEKLEKCPCGMKKGESVPKKSIEQEKREDEAATEKVAITEKKGKAMKKAELVEQMNKSEDTLVKAIERMHEKGMRKKTIKKGLISAGVTEDNVKKAMKSIKKAKEASKAKEKAAKKIMAMEEKEHGTKDPKELVEAEKKEHGMKKSDENAKHILEEEKQSNDTAQMTEESKDLGDHLKMGEDNKRAQKDVNNMKVEGMKKSVPWSSEDALLKANTGGRNFHFDVGDFVEGMLKAEEEEKKRRKDGKPSEEKKEMKKADINDLIEKGQDRSWFQEDMTKSLEAADASKTGKLVKSFNEVEDMATLLGLTPEEAKKILG